MIWPDFKFGAPQFNELTFDHWIVVEAELVPIDKLCLVARFIWQVALDAPVEYPLTAVAPFDLQIKLDAPLEYPLTAAASLDWQVSLSAELRCT